jgi:LuxR family maltose regulon positive regulatory protein
LLSLLDAGLARALTLVVAPAGYGKTELLAAWCRGMSGACAMAWLALDAHDNDPITFWTYVVHALRRAHPDRFGAALAALAVPGSHVLQAITPPLLNELWSMDQTTVLVLDDVHVVEDAVCRDSLRAFLPLLPPTLHLVLVARSAPSQLGLGRLRAQGKLAELGEAELRFTRAEAQALLNSGFGLELSSENVAQLEERTDGWAAGLYLAGLSLREHPDPAGFIAGFRGEHLYVVDYFGSEVLGNLSAVDRDFLAQTAVLDKLSGPLCDALLDTSDASQRLRALATQNLFVFPMDETWQWYRYHPLFRDLLLQDLERRYPERVAGLRRRAVDWFRAAGDATAAVHQAQALRDERLMGDLFLEFALAVGRQGRRVTVTAWLEHLSDAALAARPALALAAAWSLGLDGRPPTLVSRLITLAEAGPDQGPYFWGEPTRAAAIALARARFVVDDVGAAVADAETAVAACGDPGTPAYLLARSVLGQALYLAGRPVEAQQHLEGALRAPSAPHQMPAVSRTMATLALVCLARGDEARAEELARRSVQLVAELGNAGAPNQMLKAVAWGVVLMRLGRLDEAAAVLAQGIEVHLAWLRAWPVMYAMALGALAMLHNARGEPVAAGAWLEEARTALRSCRDPGMLPKQLNELEGDLRARPRRPLPLVEPLSEAELRILRLMASSLTQREIGQELYLSVNTVKTHTRAIYGKLSVDSRDQAVRRARTLGLIA